MVIYLIKLCLDGELNLCEVITKSQNPLYFELESNICFIIHQIQNPEWCIRKRISNSTKLKVNCSIIIRIMYPKDMQDL